MRAAAVSIGIPVFNGQAYLREALDCVVGQTYRNIEIVISDNGSTDDTEAICREYADRDSRIRYFRHEQNRGAAWNHNFVVRESTSDYFKWHSYDDRIGAEFVERCMAAFDEHPEIILAFTGSYIIDEHGDVVQEYPTDLPWQGDTASIRVRNLLGKLNQQTLLHMCYPVYGVISRRDLLASPLIGAFNGSDDVLLVDLAMRGPWWQVPDRLFSNRRHPGSSVPGHTPEEIAHWFDPAKGKNYPMPSTRLFLGYAGAVARVPMSPRERARCAAVLVHWIRTHRRWRIIGGELKLKAREALPNGLRLRSGQA